jgi:predicted thioesterase
MKNPFRQGDQKVYETEVTAEKAARFDTGLVHPVYSTFALSKDVEWVCRLFVLEMKEADEEGVGSRLEIEHLYPAPQGSSVTIIAALESVIANEVNCSFEASANGYIIARGKQSQKIINKSRFSSLVRRIIIK